MNMLTKLRIPALFFLLFTFGQCQQSNDSSNPNSQAMEDLIKSFYDVYNNGNFDELDNILAEDYVLYEDGRKEPSVEGREVYKQSLQSMRGAYSDFKITVSDILVQGNKVSATWRLTGKHTGDMGELKATGKEINISGVLISTIKDKLIAEEQSYYNQLDFMAQLGYSLSAPQGSQKTSNKRNNSVVINGKTLSQSEVAELEQKYGVRAEAGNYWYDKVSGLFGVVGYPSAGFMFPNHNFGKLDFNASNGDTGVFVNGRQLPRSEWAVWSQIIGNYIQPGRYWFDSLGNAGYEGNPAVLVNFYMAAAQRGYQGGGGGDNQWSTRFSAGNSSGGSGYVRLPNGGMVGY